MRQAFRQARIPEGDYSGHSFRIGAATMAAHAGIEDSIIQVLGRWNSHAFSGISGWNEILWLTSPGPLLPSITNEPRAVQFDCVDSACSNGVCLLGYSPQVYVFIFVLHIVHFSHVS